MSKQRKVWPNIKLKLPRKQNKVLLKHLYKMLLYAKKGSTLGYGGCHNSHLHIGIDLVDIQPSAEDPSTLSSQSNPRIFHTHTHTRLKNTIAKKSFQLQTWLFFLQDCTCGCFLLFLLITHFLWDLVRVENARNRHLDLVFLFLGLA